MKWRFYLFDSKQKQNLEAEVKKMEPRVRLARKISLTLMTMDGTREYMGIQGLQEWAGAQQVGWVRNSLETGMKYLVSTPGKNNSSHQAGGDSGL